VSEARASTLIGEVHRHPMQRTDEVKPLDGERPAASMATVTLHTTSKGLVPTEGRSLEELLATVGSDDVAWMDIVGPNEAVKSFLLDTMAFDELAVEDVFGIATTASLKFAGHRFFVALARDSDDRLDTEPLSIFVKNNLLLTVRHTDMPALNPFARRLKHADPDDVALGVDFLLYELLDAIADDWTPILSRYSNDLDRLEFQVFDPSTMYENLLEGLHDLKLKLREANKSIESLHTVTMRISQPGDKLVSAGVAHYFADLHQLTTALVKRVSNYSAGATSTRDTYLSHVNLQLAQSNARLAEVTTTLTVIGSIILPLTLISGIFGMNNHDLPTDIVGGFWGIMGLMGGFALLMLTYFWRRGWIGQGR